LWPALPIGYRFNPFGSTAFKLFITDGKFWVNNHAHIVKSIDGIILDYLCYYINSLHLDQYVTGTAQPKLTQANLNKIPINIPISQLEQQKIILEIESRLSVCDKIEESIGQSLQQAETLRQSILKKAFEGKLVSQDPKDEPASVLLDRIIAEREKAQPVKKTKTKLVKP
jgi:type I restriction enzyme S subunit